jgi:hypothetical protein
LSTGLETRDVPQGKDGENLEETLIKWCQRRDLNPRPKAYESSALPLSYSGVP